MHVTDYDGNEYILQATSTNDGDLNGNQSVSMLIESNEVNDLFINEIDKLWTVTDLDNVEHKIIYLNKKGSGDKLTVNIKGIPLFFHKFDSDRIYEEYNEHMTAQLAFTRIFKDTGFTFALVDSFQAVQWEGFGGGETKLETFKRAINRYGAEFDIVGNIVYIKKLIGNDTNHMYRHRLNASNIVQEIDAGEMWTYAKGYADYGDGEGGEDWKNAKLTSEYTSPLAKILGVLHAPPIKNGNIKDITVLDQQLKTLVDESLKISITADIHDLSRQNYPIAQSQLGDRVFVIDERIGLDEEVRIVNKSITRNWRGEIKDVTLTFGSEGLAKRHQSNLNTALKNVTDWITGRKTIPYSIVDEAIKNATQALKNAQTELKFENGILAIDKQDPNKVVLFNSAGVGISSDGGNTFRTAMTGDGLVADVVYTGTLNADRVTIFGGSATEYLSIVGNEIETRGKYTRTWFGETKTHDVGIQLRYGRLRFHNYDNKRNLYFSETGISTYLSGSDSEDGGNFGSGTIEFFSYRHNNAIRGLTLYSNNGVVALESEQRNVVIAPRYSSYANGRKFSFDTKAVTNEGYITYGKSGIRFSEGQTSGEPIIHATNSDGDLASGSFYGRSFFGDLKPRGEFAYVVASRLRVVTDDKKDVYAPIQVSDVIQTSSRDKKDNINKLDICATDALCDLEVITFDYINGEKNRIGVEAEKSPFIADSKAETVSLGDTIFLNVKAVQELNERITKLEELLA